MSQIAIKPIVRLKQSDIENLRTGQPVKLTGNFYPSIKRYIQSHLAESASSKIGNSTFTKLVIASFGDGKSTLCAGIEREWKHAQYAVSHTFIRNEAKLNNIHLNLLKGIATQDQDFFDLLLDIGLTSKSSKNQILQWAYKNHESLTLVINDSSFREGFWDWFAGDRIMRFNDFLTAHNIDRFPNKNDKDVARQFLYVFCEALSKNNLHPLLIIDELETISAFRNSSSAKVITTQLREILDNANTKYNLVITSTEAFFQQFATDYRAIHERLYNEPSDSAHSATWHLSYMRDKEAIRDYLRLIKNSCAQWDVICDKDTDRFIEMLIPNEVEKIDLRITLRIYILNLDESTTANGAYRGYIYKKEQPKVQAETVFPDENRLRSVWETVYGAEPKRLYAPAKINDDEEGLFFDYDSSYYNLDHEDDEVEAGEIAETLLVTEIENSTDEIENSTDEIENKTDEIASESMTIAEQLDDHAIEKAAKEARQLHKRTVERVSAFTIESFSTALAKARNTRNLRIISSDNCRDIPALIKPNGELVRLDFKYVYINQKQSYFTLACYNAKGGKNYLVIKPKREAVENKAQIVELVLSQLNVTRSLEELRRMAYMVLVQMGDMLDDLEIDTLIINLVRKLGGKPAEAREGALFLKPKNMLINSRHQFDNTDMTRYRDKVEY